MFRSPLISYLYIRKYLATEYYANTVIKQGLCQKFKILFYVKKRQPSSNSTG